MGHLRGQAVWGGAGMSVPWSTPDLPHTVLEFGHDGTAVRPPTTTDDARAAVVAIPAGTHTLEGVVYGAADWRWAEKLLIALHGGPLSAWHFEFSPMFNQLVASGFVVVAVNQRGSVGYGRR